MPLGAFRLTRRVLAILICLCAGAGLVACGSSRVKGPPSGLTRRVLASQGVSSTLTFGGLVIVNAYTDTVARIPPIGAGVSPGLMAISPTRNIVVAFDETTNTVFAVDTARETDLGHILLPGITSSMVVPTADPIGYAAVPAASVNGYSFLGGIEMLSLTAGGIMTTIAVPNAQTVVSNSDGSQLLVFSNDSDSVTALFPSSAVPPVDLSCLDSPPNAVCTIVQDSRLSRPVYAVVSGNNAYILNCGFECGGSQQASVAVLDLNSLTITGSVPVNGATYAFLSGTTLYVAGNGTPTGPPCSSLTNSINAATAAVYCGTLDIVDLTTLTDPYYANLAMEIAIPDGYHVRMDMSSNGQLFVGSRDCTNIGNVNNPSGEVRGCLAILNTLSGKVVIPPDNGNVDGLQSFVSRYIEYVAEGGNLRVYDTTKDILYINTYNNYLPTGTVPIVGYVGDVKAIDFF